ncbi:MAG TPA: transglutaminase domain-containing protein [Acidimicrobiales bacterium]|nr:transglutaminase domain-containing protein [Acidimicrobiales bacterium]
MTLLDDDRDLTAEDGAVSPIVGDALGAEDRSGDRGAIGTSRSGRRDDDFEPPPLRDVIRPVLAAAFSTMGAGLLTAGIFDSWSARAIAVLGALVGPAWAAFALRSPKRGVAQLTILPALLVLSLITLVLLGGSPAELPTLVADALEAGRSLRPPVPFDPGWGPILVTATALLGFAAAMVAATLQRQMLAVAVPIPVIAITAISQPKDAQLLAGIFAFVPILASLAVLFGGDASKSGALGGEFELKRALRGLAGLVPLIVALVLLNSASFLFPAPVYDPTDKPQKPKAVPLSAADDRVLFEVTTDSGITGPWRTGVLDVYEDDAFKLPPFDTDRFQPLAADGLLETIRGDAEQLQVSIAVRDLGDSSVLPMLATSTSVDLTGADVVFDPRTQLLRVPEGRVPAGVQYTLSLPAYPTGDQLGEVGAFGEERALAEQLDVPDPPAVIESLLQSAPQEPWARLDVLRKRLLAEVTAEGAGAPVDVTPEKVVDLLEGSKVGTPFEIVAAEALLARWAGVPSRIGFGFDGLNDESGTLTVRPKNSAQWLEAWFPGYGWVPLIGQPDKARTELDSDPNARFNPAILPSDDVAVEVYVPVEVQNLRMLYERVREVLFRVLPFVLVAMLAYVAWPAGAKAWRRQKRRRWGVANGPQAQVAVEYAELRDLAIDLNVGDEWDTPLEWMYKVQPDDEHLELAWLAARALYGDMRDTVTEADARAAEELAGSMRRRLSRGQPGSTRVIAAMSRTSIERPFTTELPNVRMFTLPRIRLPRLRLRRLPRPRFAGGRG